MHEGYMQMCIIYVDLRHDIWIEGRISSVMKFKEGEDLRHWKYHEVLINSLKHWDCIVIFLL